jgi:hypothetical protein
MNEAIALITASRAAGSSARSARPHAPVVAEPGPRESLTTRSRAHLGVALQALGRWVEPGTRGTVTRVAAEG